MAFLSQRKLAAMDALTTQTTESGAPAEVLSVLVVDDEADGRDSLELAVGGLGFSCRSARDGVEAWEAYEAKRADIILSDWKMPRMDGLGLCEKVRANAAERPYTHFIFVTGNDDKAHFIHAMRAGADDFIAKPVDLDELQARLEVAGRAVMVHRRLWERNSSLQHDSQRLRVAARTDSLTNAFNRLALAEDLETLAACATRYGHRYCAALCDVDEFKAYNDHFGHLPGDEVLRSIAGAIHGELRRGDVFYRYGGEEFLVILPEQALAEAALGMDRLRRAVERLSMPHAPTAGRPFVTISVGVAEMGTAPTELIDGWLRRTDAALYAAKARGRNCIAAEGEA
jgi:two-component system, cell cycle response regulator